LNIYHLNNALIVVYAFILFRKGTNNLNKKIFLLLSFGQMFLIAALRYGIGYDYNMYSIGFFDMGRESVANLSYIDWEFGFNLYTKLIYKMFPNNINLYFIITAFIIIAPVVYYIYKYSNAVWLSVLCYVNFYFFYMSMNFLRQAMAVSIALLCFRFIRDKRPFKFLLVVFVAMSFHYTAFILIPVYILVKLTYGLRTWVMYCFLLMFVYISSDGVLNLVTEFYHPEYRDSVFLNKGIAFQYVFISIIFLILTLICSNRLVKLDNTNKIYINLMYFSSFWIITMLKHSILERFSYYTYIIVVLVLIPNIYIVCREYIYEKIDVKYAPNNIFKKGLYKSALISSFLVLLFINNHIGLTAPQFTNSSNSYGVHGILPYKIWFEKN